MPRRSHSLLKAFSLLFLVSFLPQFGGSLHDYNDEQLIKHLPTLSPAQYLGEAHFWFEYFQNWQSEFLAVPSIVLLSIWLRQKGSPNQNRWMILMLKQENETARC